MIGNTEFTSDFFDNASTCWKENKRSTGNGTYVYKCMRVFETKKGKKQRICGRTCVSYCNDNTTTFLCDRCKHNN